MVLGGEMKRAFQTLTLILALVALAGCGAKLVGVGGEPTTTPQGGDGIQTTEPCDHIVFEGEPGIVLCSE